MGFAEIAPPFTTVGVIATRGNNVLPDGGLLCNNVGSDPHFAFTGQAALASGAITFLPVMLRAASVSAPGGPCWANSDCEGVTYNRTCTVDGGGIGVCCYAKYCDALGECCGGDTCMTSGDGGYCTP